MDHTDVQRLLRHIETALAPALEEYVFEPIRLPPFLTYDVDDTTLIFWSMGDGHYEAMIPRSSQEDSQ